MILTLFVIMNLLSQPILSGQLMLSNKPTQDVVSYSINMISGHWWASISIHVYDIVPTLIMHSDGVLTLTLPSCCGLFPIHLKLELLTQFPAPNDKK